VSDHIPVRQWPTRTGRGFGLARCTVERLTQDLGLEGITRGRRFTVTTRPSRAAPRIQTVANLLLFLFFLMLLIRPTKAFEGRENSRRPSRTC
jgi:hypothetical protein